MLFCPLRQLHISLYHEDEENAWGKKEQQNNSYHLLQILTTIHSPTRWPCQPRRTQTLTSEAVRVCATQTNKKKRENELSYPNAVLNTP